ncbi:hypothetical protein [Hymenobacter seoulensis]
MGATIQRVAAWALAGFAAVGGLVACENETELVPNQSAEYYPLEVGSYRVYDVVDTAYRSNVATVTRFQFKEQVDSALEPDATGQPAYRVVRSRRANASEAWSIDSVITVTSSTRSVQEQRNNRRTVELIFPLRDGKAWNANAFNTLDTIEAVNRSYEWVDKPFTISSNGKSYSYPSTTATINDLTNADTGINLFYYTVLRSVYAKGVGPVYRARRRFIYCPAGNCTPNPAYIYLGQSRSEVLVESGK